MKRLSSFKGLQEKDIASFCVPPPAVSALRTATEAGKQQHEERFHQPGLLNDGAEEVEEDEELCSLGQSSLGEKKRRLSAEQVKALELNFEVENKLDPERKVRLAQEVGLQPRQVAIWFQNRRARWKTKQLERDYGVLRARHDALKLDFEALRRDKEALEANVKELKAELARSAAAKSSESTSDKIGRGRGDEDRKRSGFVLRDGASDSDSSVVFNDEASPYNSGAAALDHGGQQQCFMGFKVQEDEEIINCSGFFSDQQEAPSLSWCWSEGWE